MRHHSVRAIAAIAALTFATACDDTSTGTSGDRLTESEAAFLASTLGTQSSAAASSRVSSISADVAARSSVPSPFNFSLETTVPCPLGGNSRVTASMSGMIDQAAHSLTADLAGSLAPSGCILRSREGVSFTISGTPGLSSDAHVDFTNGQPTGVHTASLEGSFNWTASDGRSGACSVDYAATANYTSNEASVNGDFCGSRVTFTGPLR
jgi:hypothetical protein